MSERHAAFVLRAGVLGLLLLIGGVVAHVTGYTGRFVWTVVLLGVVALTVVGLVRRGHRGGSAVVVDRWARRSRRNQGVASDWAVLRYGSRWAMLRRAHVWRPSLAAVGWWRRWLLPTREYAVRVAMVGGLVVYSPIEDVTLRVGGPRTGKSGEMADHIADAPGAVIATSTRLDLLRMVGPLRARRGPVSVFNPSGLGGLPSTVSFDPVRGCGQPATAYARAEDLLVGDVHDGERGFWVAQGRRVLSGLLHAAALGEASMLDVLRWVSAPDAAKAEVTGHLRRSPTAAFCTTSGSSSAPTTAPVPRSPPRSCRRCPG